MYEVSIMRTNFLLRLAAILLLSAAIGGMALQMPHHSSAETREKHVRFLHIADTHAQLDTHWEYLPEDPNTLHKMGGFARIKTALDEFRNSAPGAVFTLDGGDTFQGSAVAAWTKGEAIVAPLNALRIDVGIPGNWDVVYGPDTFKMLLHEVNYKVLCYNFQDSRTGKRIFPPSAILEKDGVRVAFIGVTDPTTTKRQPPAEVQGLDSTHMEGLRSYVQNLKAAEHPDLVVLVDHTGLAPSVQLAHDIPELDIVLSAHTHERVYEPILVGHTIVVEPGSLGSFLGKLDITLKDGKIVDHNYQLVYIDGDHFPEDPKMRALIQNIENPYRMRMDRVIGMTNTPLMRDDVLESTMDDLVADSVREAAHSDIGVTNGFRFSPPIAPGPITEADLWNMLPLDARMKVGETTGRQLRSYLEDEMELVFAQNPFALSGGWGPRPSGMEITFHARAPKGERIRSIRVNGNDVADAQLYTFGGCERDGESLDTVCRMRDVRNVHYVPGTIHEALESFIRKHSPLNYRRQGRVRADDLPSVVWSQYGILQDFWNLPGASKATEVPGKN